MTEERLKAEGSDGRGFYPLDTVWQSSIGLLETMKIHLLIAALLAAVQWSLAQPAEIILIRHAEKPDDPEAVHLSKAGEKRAKELVPFVMNNSELTQHGLPVALYATETTKHGRGQRTQETITPLSQALHLSIQTPYSSEDYTS